MADNRISETRRPADPDQKTEDPLAELARIVGFEDENGRAADQNAASQGAESGFDLEAELMRELQIDVGDEAEQAGPTFASAEPPAEARVASVQQEIQATASKMANEQPVAPQPSEPMQSTAEGTWPHATSDTAAQLNSLEAELQAAFSALEGKRPEPTPAAPTRPQAEPVEEAAAVEAPVPQTEPVQMPAASVDPIDGLSESDELKEAYDRLQRDIEAARPVEEELDDVGDDLTEMLLAEMADVEAEAADNMPAEMPFDPSDIAEADHAPETMADLDVPDYDPEPVATLRPKDDDFGLPLEDELDVLRSPDPVEERADVYQHPQSHAQPNPRAGVQQTSFDAGDVAYAATTAHDVYEDEPGMEGYQDDYDDDVFPGDDDFAAEDLVPPDFNEYEDERDQGSGRKGLIAAVVVLAIAIAGGAGFYVWNSGFGGSSAANGGPVIIAASEEPVKVKPDDPGGKTVPNEDRAVFEELSGSEAAETTDQNLVTTIEEPVDVVQRTLDPDTLPLEGRATASDPIAKSEERLAVSDSLDPDPSADSGTNGVAPRRVRTLVVRPDGTIVARENPVETAPAAVATGVAGSTNEPIITGTTAAAAGTETGAAAGASADSVEIATVSGTLPVVAVQQGTGGGQASAQGAALPPIDEQLRNSGALPLPVAKPATVAATSSAPAATQVASVQTGAGDQRAAASAPVPTTRPAEQPVNIVEAVTERGNLAGSNQANPGGYMVQISSQPSEEAARASYESLSQRYASIIGGRGVNIQRANIENRGVFYRVRIPAGSREDANSLCTQYKSAGGSCFVAR